MSITEVMSSINLGEVAKDGGIFLILVMTLLQISPIKVNPWSWLGKKIGKAINGEIIDKVDNLSREVEGIKQEQSEQAVINCRIRILRFGDEILHGNRHSKDHFDQTLRDIDCYEQYCHSHPNFENNVTGLTIERIKDVYRSQCDDNGFV